MGNYGLAVVGVVDAGAVGAAVWSPLTREFALYDRVFFTCMDRMDLVFNKGKEEDVAAALLGCLLRGGVIGNTPYGGHTPYGR